MLINAGVRKSSITSEVTAQPRKFTQGVLYQSDGILVGFQDQ